MRHLSKPKAVLFVAAVIVAMAALACACPFGLMSNAQMSAMMGHDMDPQQMEGMCPMLCGVPPCAVGVEPNGFVLGLLAANPVVTTTPAIRPIFHPPTLA